MPSTVPRSLAGAAFEIRTLRGLGYQLVLQAPVTADTSGDALH